MQVILNFKKSTNLGKLFFLPKMHKRLYDVPDRLVISNFGTPTEKVSECLHYHLKPIMLSEKSYKGETSDFLKRLKELSNVPQNSLLVTADVVGLYPGIPHQGRLEALSIKLAQREEIIIPTKDLCEMAWFVLKNNHFEFHSMIKQQVSGTAIGTKLGSLYVYIFMDRVEALFLEKEALETLVYIDGMFFVLTHGEDKLDKFFKHLNSFHPNLKFTSECFREEISFLDVTVTLNNKHFVSDLYCKSTDSHQYLH